jgi:hypothetical protein
MPEQDPRSRHLGLPRFCLRTPAILPRQEQTQIIATAIGKPAAKAPTIVKAKAESRLASGCSLSTDMSLTPHHADKSISRHHGCGDGARVSKG